MKLERVEYTRKKTTAEVGGFYKEEKRRERRKRKNKIKNLWSDLNFGKVPFNP